MDEFCRRTPVIPHRGLVTAGLLLLLLTGCEQLGLGKKKETPLVPPPPQRKTVEEPNAKTTRPTDSTASSPASPSAGSPVKLDGSAAGNDSVSVPNMPTTDGARMAAAATAELPTGDSDAANESEGSRTADEIDGSEPAKGASKPGKIVQVGGRVTEGDQQADDPGADVISPIEIEGAGAQFKRGQVAVLVNGVPIFVEDVLRTIPEELLQKLEQGEKALAAGALKPEEIRGLRNFRRSLVESFLQPHIQQELLLQALKSRIKKENLDGIKKQLDAQFDAEYLPKVLKDKGYASTVELERELEKQGSSIEAIRTGFRNKQLAQQYLGSKALAKEGFDVPDIRNYYKEHLEDYAISAKAKWEQIQVKFEKNGGKEGARKKAGEIVKRLENGEVFAVVAKECSDGTTKSKGGAWGWTTQGSVKSKAVDQALFEQPVGEIGPPIETEMAIEIIRVLDRTDAHYQKFDDVQEDIKAHLKEAQFKRRVGELLKELLENATLEKFTDKL